LPDFAFADLQRADGSLGGVMLVQRRICAFAQSTVA
jgi:hypothetical protein